MLIFFIPASFADDCGIGESDLPIPTDPLMHRQFVTLSAVTGNPSCRRGHKAEAEVHHLLSPGSRNLPDLIIIVDELHPQPAHGRTPAAEGEICPSRPLRRERRPGVIKNEGRVALNDADAEWKKLLL
jgi:hypothetical protein